MSPDNQGESPPAAETTAVSAPHATPAPETLAGLFKFSDIFEDSDIPTGDAGASGASTGSPETGSSVEDDADEDDEPAAAVADGVKPSEPGVEASSLTSARPLSRRAQAAAAKEAQIAELSAKLAAYESDEGRSRLREQVLAEEAQRAGSVQDAARARQDAERFAQAIRMADTDPRLNELVPGTDQTLYLWREQQKDLRDRYPEAERALRADAEHYVAESTRTWRERAETAERRAWDVVKGHLGSAIEASTKLPGVDAARFKAAGVDWAQMAQHLHAAGSASKEAELASRVEQAEAKAAQAIRELEEVRSSGLAGRRVPATVGRSGSSAPNGSAFDPSRGWRGNLADAFGLEDQ